MDSYISSVIKQFNYYKSLGDKTINQLTFKELQKEFVKDSNSMVVIVKHLCGNMLSRWTNFLDEDGEKTWRNRDDEFINTFKNKTDVITAWEKGWYCLFMALEDITEKNLNRIIYIRNEGHTVTEALNRQMMHYAYHIGQMVYLGKLIKAENWKSLSIPKGQSKTYNSAKFSKTKRNQHFTDDV